MNFFASRQWSVDYAARNGLRILECPGPATRPRSAVRWRKCAGEFTEYTPENVRCNWCAAEDRAQRTAEQKAGYRERDRGERADAAPPCEICDGPLWPEGVIPARARSDRTTCSDRCRQAKRRRAHTLNA